MPIKEFLPETSLLRSTSFVYGVATAAFQIEGAGEKRLPCIWDKFCETEDYIADGSNGLVACDHFHRWQEDVQLLSELGVDAYRLSISWPRVITLAGELNSEGVNFYIALLDELNRRNIKAFVTLYHWDLPQHLEENGGWLNRDTAYQFQHYADLISRALGNRVYAYATFNEPWCIAYLGYEIGAHAPGKKGKQFGRKAAHNVLLAHGLAMQKLRVNCPKSQHGIVLNFTPTYPASDKEQDLTAADYADEYINQWYIQPLFTGHYPSMLAELPAEQQPDIVEGDLEIICQPLDYLGVNYYFRHLYSAPEKEGEFYFQHPSLEPVTDMGWEIYPAALTKLLLDLDKKYSLPPVYITENGCAFRDVVSRGEVKDVERVKFFKDHLVALDNAITQGVDVRGYFAWSLMDNFEWAEGYRKRFGLYYVDYESQKRLIKDSGIAYKQLLASRK